MQCCWGVHAPADAGCRRPPPFPSPRKPSMQQIKGTILKSRLGFVEQHWGREGVERVLAALPPDDQRALRPILTVKWYPFEIGERLDAAIVATLGDGKSEEFERLGAASADANLTTLH